MLKVEHYGLHQKKEEYLEFASQRFLDQAQMLGELNSFQR